MTFFAVISHDGNQVLKYQDFQTQAEADVHVAAHGGFVAESDDFIDDVVPDEIAKTLTLDPVRVAARAQRMAEQVAARDRKTAARAHNDNKPVTWGDLREILIDIGAI